MDSKVITKIKNTVSGSIQLLNASDEIVRILQPIGLTAHGIREGQANEGVCIMNAGGYQEAVLVTANITDYEIYPAASAPFAGDTEDLKALLAESFFFSVSGGGTANSILLSATGIFDLGTSFITPAALAASTNDYTEAGGDDVMVWRISASAPINLTGIAAPPAGTSPFRILRNVGANNITLQKQSVLSVAANRFDFPPATIALQGGGWRAMFYDQTSARWAVLF